MPPKPKYTRDEVIQAAFELTDKKGILNVTARDVGRRLGTTPTPIFTYFSGMDELKEAVYQKALRESIEYLSECNDYSPAFKEFGLRWIRYAYEHPNIYKMVYLFEGVKKPVIGFINGDFIDALKPMVYEIMSYFKLNEEQARILVNEMTVYAQGIATVCIQTGNYDEDDVNLSIGRVCVSLVNGLKLEERNIDVEVAMNMMQHLGDYPVKKN